jgi:hypothetical protein
MVLTILSENDIHSMHGLLTLEEYNKWSFIHMNCYLFSNRVGDGQDQKISVKYFHVMTLYIPVVVKKNDKIDFSKERSSYLDRFL